MNTHYLLFEDSFKETAINKLSPPDIGKILQGRDRKDLADFLSNIVYSLQYQYQPNSTAPSSPLWTRTRRPRCVCGATWPGGLSRGPAPDTRGHEDPGHRQGESDSVCGPHLKTNFYRL